MSDPAPPAEQGPLGPRSAHQAQVRAESEHPEGMGPAVRLTALGTLIPGLGLALGRRARTAGLVLIGLACAVLAASLVYVVRNGALRSALDLASRPNLLRAIAVVLVVGGLVWIGSIVMTALTNKPTAMSGRQRGVLGAFTAVMCLVVAAPAGLGLRYISAHTEAVDKIFTGKPSGPQDPAASGATGPVVEAADPWESLPRVNVLLLGSDAGDDREGVRTDSMIVASIDSQSGDTVLFSIPRNLQNVPIPSYSPLAQAWPDGYDCGRECLMNGIWTEATAQAEMHPDWFTDDPAPGQTATRDVISAILGQPIHYTLIVDLKGFQELVDAMGGVDIDVQERVPMGGRTYTDSQGRSWLIEGTENGWVELGPQHLSGYQALWYARSRVTTDDFSRMRRQRCVVAAVVEQVNPLNMLQNYPAIVAAAGDNITVDIAQQDLPAWAELVSRVQGSGSIRSLPFTIKNTDVSDPDYADIRAQVAAALQPPAPTPTSPTATGGTTGPTTASRPRGRPSRARPATTPRRPRPTMSSPTSGRSAEGADAPDVGAPRLAARLAGDVHSDMHSGVAGRQVSEPAAAGGGVHSDMHSAEAGRHNCRSMLG